MYLSLRALLIQIGVKQMCVFFIIPKFESFVNSDRCKAKTFDILLKDSFESFVNSDRCKALFNLRIKPIAFESFVNSDRCKASFIQ